MIKNCEYCNELFKTKPSHFERRRFCSRKCRQIVQPIVPCDKSNTGFWQNASEEEKWIRIQQEYDRLVIKNEEGCYDWKHKSYKNEYTKIYMGNAIPNFIRGHRAIWIINNGPIPENMCVLHHCDNPRCTRLSHLFLGTKYENNKDKMNKGRNVSLHGESNKFSKLVQKDVLDIKKSSLLNKELCEKYKVCRSTIQRIKNNRAWKHIKE